MSLQKTSDVFAGDAFGGIDTHFLFCAINSLKLFGQLGLIQIRPWNTLRNVRTLTVGLVVVWVQRSIPLKVHNSHRTQCGQQTKLLSLSREGSRITQDGCSERTQWSSSLDCSTTYTSSIVAMLLLIHDHVSF